LFGFFFFGLSQGIHARVRPHPTSLVINSVTEHGPVHGPVTIPMRKADLLAAARKGDFFSYAAGVAYKILTDYHVAGLVVDNFLSDLPIEKGLSSSAAICVLVARGFNVVYDLKMTVRGEMEYAYQGEILTPSQCGRMDQVCKCTR
jgi:galactokinase